ncbi:MAG TPA: hypothetical protein VF692_14790 [Pyrinomonadaceae bacterium]|jgi:hypothetical protein
MKTRAKKQSRIAAGILSVAAFFVLSFNVSCEKAANSSSLDILTSSDETAEAGQTIIEANRDLNKIKVLYKENEGKREEIKKAMEANDAEAVRKISDDVVYLINDGMVSGKEAIEKIQRAQEMAINEDYREYLRLKEESLTRQLDAFENYRQAAIALRNNYDPKDKAMREKIKEEFKNRSENYRKIMESARDYSKRANELAKEKASARQ